MVYTSIRKYASCYICLSRHNILPGNPAQNKILPRYHAALHFLENLPENLVGGLAAPSLHRGQLLIIPGQKETLMTEWRKTFSPCNGFVVVLFIRGPLSTAALVDC